MFQPISIEENYHNFRTCLIIDVRSPSEYQVGHVKNALNIPLFSDEERKEVGITYKKIGKQQAIKLGMEYFGPKMRRIVEKVEQYAKEKSDKRVLVYCWRGGMRSGAMAWLLDIYGFEVYQVIGGYKAYRNWVLEIFNKDYNLKVIGGYTGSNKTQIIKEIQEIGKQAIDLEKLANHKGSAFGHIGEAPQPTQEQFENNLAERLFELKNEETIYLEDESVRLGLIHIPQPFFIKMQKSKMYFFEVPFEERLERVVKQYGYYDKTELINAIKRIEKRLGGLNTKNAINYLLEDNTIESFRILLQYYDRYYLRNLEKRKEYSNDIVYINDKSVLFT